MINDEALKLDNQLCFALYACSREITRLYRPLLDQIGVTYPQYLVLLALWEKDGVTLKELGEKLYLDSGTLTPLLKRMEAIHLLTRKRSAEDERKILIHLTEAGKKLKNQVCQIPKKLLEESGYSREEFMRLLDGVKGLLARVHDQFDSKNE